MKNSLFVQTKLVFLENGANTDPFDDDKWGNPYNKGRNPDSMSGLSEKNPNVMKLNELGKQLSRYTDNLPTDMKPVDIKTEEDGMQKVRKLIIKKENAQVRISIVEQKSPKFLIKSDFYFDHTTGKYLKGRTSIKFNDNIATNNDANPFVLLKLLPPIISLKSARSQKSRPLMSRVEK